MVRRSVWERTGGFDPDYFMYGEDLDLSLRIRLLGMHVGVVPSALVEHAYEFDKGRRKWFWLERNRWLTLIRVYPTPVLALLAPALVLSEFAVLLLAAKGGWLSAKLRAHAALATSLPSLARRRAIVQRTRRVDAETFAAALSATVDSPYLSRARLLYPLVWLQERYWRAVRMCLALHR
jgi:GT2 family glycosyltransferase